MPAAPATKPNIAAPTALVEHFQNLTNLTTTAEDDDYPQRLAAYLYDLPPPVALVPDPRKRTDAPRSKLHSNFRALVARCRRVPTPRCTGWRGLSRMKGNFHVRFLEGGGLAIARRYSVKQKVISEDTRLGFRLAF